MNFMRVLLAAAFSFATLSAHAAKPIVQPMPVGEDLSIEVVPAAAEIQVDVPDSSAATAQFGLIGALIGSAIDNSAAKKAEAKMAPLRDKLIGISFQQELENILRERLPGSGLATTPQMHFLTGAEQIQEAESIKQRPLRAMIVTPRYAFNTGMTNMYVRLSFSLVERTAKSSGKFKTASLFSRNYTYGFALDNPGKPEENQARWLAMPDAQLVDALKKALGQSVDMVVYDFSEPGRAEWNLPPVKGERHGLLSIQPGRKIKQENGITWVRTGKGAFQALEGFETAGVAEAAVSVPADSAAQP